MPFFRLRQTLVYFAHVPKCAGSSLEVYLQRRFGRLAFRDQAHYRDPGTRWTRTSPQHVTVADLDRLIPARFFGERFTMLRHPVPRLVSVFRFQRDWEGRIDRDTGLTEWLDGLGRARRNSSYRLDNHLRPMTAFVPEDSRIFRLEEGGLAQVIPWLDDLQGKAADPREMPVLNTHGGLMAKRGAAPRAVTVTSEDRARIAALYAEDFARFGYDPDVVPEDVVLAERHLPPRPNVGQGAPKQALQKGHS
jgi:hypothetical protein